MLLMLKKPNSDPAGCTADILALQDTLAVVGGKWTLLILHYLLIREDEVVTFKKMEKDLVGISAKVLTATLKLLEENKLIQREVLETRPIKVQYSITPYGREIQELLQVMVKWG